MTALTTTGYHRPIGADPVEPAGGTYEDKLGRPADAGILADTIETAHPRCEVGAGSLDAGTLPLGALSHQNVAGAYTKPATFSVAVPSAGLYRCTARVQKSGGANSWSVYLNSTAGIVDKHRGPATENGDPMSLAGEIRLAAGDVFSVEATVTTDQAQVLAISIQRVGP